MSSQFSTKASSSYVSKIERKRNEAQKSVPTVEEATKALEAAKNRLAQFVSPYNKNCDSPAVRAQAFANPPKYNPNSNAAVAGWYRDAIDAHKSAKKALELAQAMQEERDGKKQDVQSPQIVATRKNSTMRGL